MKKRVSAILIAAIVAGCTTTPQQPAEARGRDQTRAFAGDCVFRQPQAEESGLSGVIDAIFGGIISGALGRIGAALRAAGEEDADVVVGRYPAEFEPGNPASCIIIAKGGWTSDAAKAWKTKDISGNNDVSVKVFDYHLIDPTFVLEVAVQRSAGGKALRLVPNYFEYRRLIEDSSEDDDRKNRGIAFEVAVHAAGVGPTDQNAVGATMVLGTMTTGYAYNLRSGQRRAIGRSNWGTEAAYLPLEYTSAWFPTFAPEAQTATNSKQTQSATRSALSSGSPSPAGSTPAAPAQNETKRQLLPRTVTVTFTETRAPRKLLLFLADVFDASKEEIQAAAEIAVLESKKAEAELAAAQASTTLMTEFLTKLSEAEVAIINYCNASSDSTPAGRSDRLTKSSAANVAQRKANVSALAASQPQPYTSFVPVSDDQVDSNFCSP